MSFLLNLNYFLLYSMFFFTEFKQVENLKRLMFVSVNGVNEIHYLISSSLIQTRTILY